MFKKVSTDMDFPRMEEEILRFWSERQIYKKSLEQTRGGQKFVFYEGPPTANGLPHPGHVLTRAMKDIIPRYKTMLGSYVFRKGGWDTHGLPVELEVEKELGISGKPQIERYGVEEFIEKCKESVFRYRREWERMTERVGFWIDLEHPYVTYHNEYIESVWWALKTIWEEGLLYKGHKVVPYCPRCGTALSSHEVAQGYEEVEDPSVYVKFKVEGEENTFFLVWTTTPWTLPSNVALAVSPDYTYATIEIISTGERFILAKDLIESAVKDEYRIKEEFEGEVILNKRYQPLFDFVEAGEEKPAYRVIAADFVTLTEGTGIVHMAPAFGEDDMRMAVVHDLPVVQLVDTQGRFTEEVTPWQGMFVKEADPLIIEDMKRTGKLYRAEPYRHSYPFCWRCDTPLLYYARTSWFIQTTAVKDALLRNNAKINWYPNHIKEGRFGNFLENVIDWAVSRERYWGTPLNIWICSKCGHEHPVGSIEELRRMARSLPERLELHRPYIDRAILACPECGGDMRRTPEVIDTWFDSGSMPFAQWHYPFENKDVFEANFPADFISEAIDQTRGWFYTLLVVSTLLFDETPYKNVVVLGHVLDAEGEKMSKHKGNVVDIWQIFNNQGADAMRWYLYTVNPPWNPTRFYIEAISESQRKFLGTLWNVYAFYVLYANVDGFDPRAWHIEPQKRPLLDRWLISRVNSLARKVREALDGYDVTDGARAIEEFVDELSNWYVRRSRRRYWGPEMNEDKVSAYLTLHEALVTLAKMLAPFTPFVSEAIYQNIARGGGECQDVPESVHLCSYPECDDGLVDAKLEERMELARRLVYLGRAARNKANIKNRQPLPELACIAASQGEREDIRGLEDLIKDELNVKALTFADDIGEFVSYRVKPRYDLLGPKYGKLMPKIASALAAADAGRVVAALRRAGNVTLELNGMAGAASDGGGDGDSAGGGKSDTTHVTLLEEEIAVEAIEKEGYCVATDGPYSVALNITPTPELVNEGFARELVNKIQTMRKEADFDIEDRIKTRIWGSERIRDVVEAYRAYLMDETLSQEMAWCGECTEVAPTSECAEERPAGSPYTKRWNVNGEDVTISVVRDKAGAHEA
ncbi:MAG: isoleucine--tRNA ligase [Firmicutes bacterium]|nr:isoleucine--tRNA ligase [Bacillota bacterium]